MVRSRTTRERADRIDLNYFKRPHPMRQWMRFAFLSAGVVAGAWLIVDTLLSRQASFEPGPVSTRHTLFDQQCAQCHSPLRGEIYWRRVSDQACSKCHDGPIHHQNQTFTPDCSRCHAEHKGQAVLARVSDEHCTQCHSHLTTRRPAPHIAACLVQGHRLTQRIDGFTDGHPDFAVFRAGYQDGAQIKLNHQVHLKPDLKGLEKLRGAPDVIEQNGRFTLACSFCHQPDSKRAYMAPINYEKNCLICHALDFDPRFPDTGVPHKKVEIVIPFVQEKLSQYILDHPEELRRTRIEPVRRLPGEPRYRQLPMTARAWVDQQVEKAKTLLFRKTCVECHTLKTPPGQLPAIVPPGIPNRWLVHSTFGHEAHRALMCIACHVKAPASQKTVDVLLPDIQTCRQCHRQSGGARADCAECHTYHDKANERGLNGTLGVQQLMR